MKNVNLRTGAMLCLSLGLLSGCSSWGAKPPSVNPVAVEPTPIAPAVRAEIGAALRRIGDETTGRVIPQAEREPMTDAEAAAILEGVRACWIDRGAMRRSLGSARRLAE